MAQNKKGRESVQGGAGAQGELLKAA